MLLAAPRNDCVPQRLRPAVAAGVDRIVAALPWDLDPRDMADLLQLDHDALNGALAPAALARDGGDRGPGPALVAGAVCQRQKHELLAVRQVKFPHNRHDTNAHTECQSSPRAAL